MATRETVQSAGIRGTAPGQPHRNVLAFAARHLEVRMFVVLLALGAVLSLLSPYFLSTSNLFNIMDQSVVTGIAAIGQTFVILVAGIDLSVGSLVGVTGVVLGLSMAPFGMVGGVIAALLAGAFAGFINGFIVTKGRIASFIVTLGMLSIGRSMAYILSGESSITVPMDFSVVASGHVLGIPFNVLALVVLYVLAWLYLSFTKGGRTLYALGSNAEAARVAGLRVDRYRILAFVVSGVTAAIAAVFLSARVLSIDPIAGTGMELDTIAAVVIGGASLFGGRASIIGTLLGGVIMVLIRNGLNLMNVSPYWQGTAIGSIIIAAVLLERIFSSTPRRSS